MNSHLQRLQKSITTTIHGMSEEELTRHPEGKWSTAEILEHLYLSFTGTIKTFQRCLEKGKPLGGSPTLKNRLQTAYVMGLSRLPTGREAPVHTRPRGISAEQIGAEIIPKIAAMDDVIAQCQARYGKLTRLADHPVLGPFTAQQWRKFHWVHGQHHMKQILRLRGK